MNTPCSVLLLVAPLTIGCATPSDPERSTPPTVEETPPPQSIPAPSRSTESSVEWTANLDQPEPVSQTWWTRTDACPEDARPRVLSSWSKSPRTVGCVDDSGQHHGRVTEYSADGLLERSYMARHGVRHGPYAEYWPPTLRLAGTYVDGELDGVWTERVEGRPVRQATFSGGRLNGEAALWNSETADLWRFQFVDEMVHGPVEKRTSDGELLVSGEFDHGRWWGTWRFLGPAGKDLGGCELPQGTGHCEVFHPNGQLERRASYVDGKPHGQDARYYDNGERQLVFEFEHGEMRSQRCFEPDGSDCKKSEFLTSESGAPASDPRRSFSATEMFAPKTLKLEKSWLPRD